MAFYLVYGTPQSDAALDELARKLADGEFVGLKPFGRALSSSLANARESGDGRLVWEEEDYCSPPLAEEREAVLDHYFDDLEWERVVEGGGWEQIEDLPRAFGPGEP